jgi:hypothetical protein
MAAQDHEPGDLHEPPIATSRVLIVGLAGAGLVFAAFVAGLATGAPKQGFDGHWADGMRAFLCVVGAIVAGCAISMRPGWYGGWLCAAAAGLLGGGFGPPPPAGTEWYLAPPRNWYAGLPNSWDSIQLFFSVMGVAALIGAVWTRLPRKAIYLLIVAGMSYHFAGILSAITSPPPTPWLTDLWWSRVARPYLQFAYMNNAYQFYSPDPGPACELWACIEYETPADSTEKDCEWIYIPRRQAHYVDPLGLSYYRLLSATENVAQYLQPNQAPLRVEQEKVLARRALAARDFIPRKGWTDEQERRVPNELVTRQILPSYARHIAKTLSDPNKKVRSVKIYRTLHMITLLNEFYGYDPVTGTIKAGTSPYDPTTYLPYYQGEYDANGKLLKSDDWLLYWLIPIVRDRELPATKEEYLRNGGFSYYYRDYVAEHAGCKRPVKE